MKVEILTHCEFNRRIKHLAKKYKSMSSDLRELVASLQQNPLAGTPLGKNTHKVRMAIMSKGGGKSGGARVITYSIVKKRPDEYQVILLTIYDKSEMESVSSDYINSLIKNV